MEMEKSRKSMELLGDTAGYLMGKPGKIEKGLRMVEESEKEEKEGEEKQQIEAWIKENNLNQYGDPEHTVYLGGTPLFDESTGERIDKYEYILRRHSDRPWRKEEEK